VPYAVRAAEPSSVAPDVTALLARNLGATCTDPRRRLEWFYLEGPFGPGIAHLLEHSDAAAGGGSQSVGCMGLGVRRYWRDGKPVDVAVLGDLAVDQRHRSLGPAMMLQRATRAYAQSHFDVCLAYPNAKAKPVVLRLGFHELGGMSRWVVPLRFSAHMRRRLPAAVAAAAGFMLDVAAEALWKGRHLRARRRYRLREADEPDARFDQLDDRARALFPMTSVRNAAFLRWRFLRRPGGTPVRFYNLVASDGAELAAYAVVEREGPIAQLRDLFGRDADAIGLLLDILLPRLRREGAEAAWFSYLGPSWLDSVLRNRGFVPRESRCVVIDAGRTPSPPPDLFDPTRWYLTEADEDS
jgi:hypothetical protein